MLVVYGAVKEMMVRDGGCKWWSGGGDGRGGDGGVG